MAQRKDDSDRRPLLYGIAAILILVAALFLFWPRGGEDASVMTFTPSSSEGEVQAEHLEAPAGTNERAASTENPASKLPPEEVAAEPIEGAAGGTSSSEVPSKSPSTPFNHSKTTAPSGNAPSNPPAVSSSPSPVQPGASGRYLLYLGSFSSYTNAQKRATELKTKGVPADVIQGSKPDGTLIYRVRVAWFEGHSKAKAYGEDLKRRLGVDYWIAER